MGKLMTKIRQKLCRHKNFEITEWNEDESRYYLFGTCKACGIERYGLVIDKKIFEDIKKAKKENEKNENA